jgi:two-component system cell cycle sensor histidine kinase/response regulator CckA
VLLSVALVRNDVGEPLYFISQIKDITERKQAEEALRESEHKFSSYIDFAPHGIFIADENGNFIEVNKAGCKITGYNSDELLKMHIFDTLPEESYEIAGNHFNRLNKEGFAAEEMMFRRKDGSLGYWSIDAVKLNDNCFVGFVVDISDRKREEQEKAKLVDQLQQSQKMESVGRLAGGVAHDFNNMLQAILGNADMAMGMIDDDHPVKESLEEICAAAERSADLTRQLLAFARKQTVAPKVLDINETVANMLKMLKRLIGEDINLNWLPGDGLWPIKIDPSQIDQMLANLCVNARDAINGIGDITIETVNITIDDEFCDLHVGFTPGEYAALIVSDNGCGMDKETLSHLFEPFFTTKGLGKGTGLGLATVYGAVRQNDGHITVYSEPGQGTTFMIYLPRYLEKAAPVILNETDKPHQQVQETILLVEDEINILKIATNMLTKLGYNVISANTPVEAIQIAESYPDEIHMVMTDVVMPEMNGRELVKSILKIYPDIKRIFMSGYTADVIAHHGVLDENVNFLQKPFSMKDLADTLRKAMGDKSISG